MRKLKAFWEIVRKPICSVIAVFCLLCLLGCTGTAENGGSLVEYAVHGGLWLAGAIVAIAVGKLYESKSEEQE